MWEEGARIYGTPGVHNNFPSQRAREGGWWDKYSSKGSDDQQVDGEDDSKEAI